MNIFHRQLQMVSNKYKNVDLLVKWTPGHINIEGNEEADREARKAVQEGSSPLQKLPAPLRKSLPCSKSAVQQVFHEKLKKAAISIWTKSPHYHCMRQIDHSYPSNMFTKQTTNMIRKHTSILFQLQTGHAPLNKHLHHIQRAESPICPCCNQHSESVFHFLMRCLAHNNARHEMITAVGRDAREVSKLLSSITLFPHLFKFIGRSERLRTVFGPIPSIAIPAGA